MDKKKKKVSIEGLTPAEIIALAFDWGSWRRPDQAVPKGDWLQWLILTGRGWGKTRTGAEFIREEVNRNEKRHLHLVGRTAADVRDTMIEGESGLLAVCKGDQNNMPDYEPSKRRITWPNGAIAITFTAAEPDALRGPQCDCYWADELASWRYARETWDMLQFGARLGMHVRGVITTTPRPVRLIKELIQDNTTFLTRGTTIQNKSNLAPSFMKIIYDRYKGTRMGRQELNGEVLEDNPNALWRRSDIDKGRITNTPDFTIIKVGVDPAATSNDDSNATGIVVAAKDNQDPPHFYILDDMTQEAATPKQWGEAAIAAYNKYGADAIVPEINNGGEMVEFTLETIDPNVVVRPVHASRGKITRAEPVSTLYEQGRVHHIGTFPELEDQLCDWEPGMDSPDRLDALVWAITSCNSFEQHYVATGLDVNPN